MKLINLTPHAIHLHTANGGVTTYAPSGTVARVAVQSTPIGKVGGAPLLSSTYGSPVDLPAKKDGVWLIVSSLVRSSCATRGDLISPAQLIRNDKGQIVGCGAFDGNL